MSNWKWALLAIVLLPVSAYVVFWVSVSGLSRWDEAWGSASPNGAQLAQAIVILPGASSATDSVQLVPFAQVEAFAGSHPGAGFLIPSGREEAIREQLTRGRPGLPWATLEVKRLSDSSQQITLEYMDRTDDTHGARYEATPTRVRLQAYRYVGDRDGMGIVLAALVLTAAVELLGVAGLVGFVVYRTGRAQRAITPRGGRG